MALKAVVQLRVTARYSVHAHFQVQTKQLTFAHQAQLVIPNTFDKPPLSSPQCDTVDETIHAVVGIDACSAVIGRYIRT
jgi:hypothetical protein